jgi:hypothetical protein
VKQDPASLSEVRLELERLCQLRFATGRLSDEAAVRYRMLCRLEQAFLDASEEISPAQR